MPCAAGHPATPCPYQYTGQVTRKACGLCKNFIPPAFIQAWCTLWDRDKILCQLPKSACESCPLKHNRAPGRPTEEGTIDWKDPAARAAYHKEYQKEYRAKNRERLRETQRRFRERHPDYFKEYYRKRRAGGGNDNGSEEV